MKKNAIITFDYEVFLGRETGTIKNCVIKPTYLILDALKKNNARAIFFVDSTWLLFLKENFNPEFKLVSEQLKEIINAGSTVELHLHPQWLQAYLIGNKIEFKSYENYKLHSLTEEKILDLFGQSIELLECITLQKVHCFRAGGYCIEPFDRVKSAFEIFDIKYDFSVAPGIRLKGDIEFDFDFTYAPNLQYYPFENDVKVPVPDGSFVEVTLSIFQNNPIYRLTNKAFLWLQNDKIYGDGVGIHEKGSLSVNSLKNRLKLSKSILSIDKTNSLFFRYLVATHFRRSNLLVIISHPKLVSKQSLANLSFTLQHFKTLNSIDLVNYLTNHTK